LEKTPVALIGLPQRSLFGPRHRPSAAAYSSEQFLPLRPTRSAERSLGRESLGESQCRKTSQQRAAREDQQSYDVENALTAKPKAGIGCREDDGRKTRDDRMGARQPRPRKCPAQRLG